MQMGMSGMRNSVNPLVDVFEIVFVMLLGLHIDVEMRPHGSCNHVPDLATPAFEYPLTLGMTI